MAICIKTPSRLDKIPVYLRKPIFDKLFKIAEYTNLNKEEKMLYDTSLKRRWDKQALIEGTIVEGLEKGMKQGLEEGAKRKQVEIAKALKLEGL
jgi:hypothetical protein